MLEPGPWFKTIADPRAWSERYTREVLSPLDPAQVVAELQAMSDGVKTIALLCWEAAVSGDADWCHRSLVSVWLHDRLGLEVFELGHESCGCGRAHPKLPAVLRGA